MKLQSARVAFMLLAAKGELLSSPLKKSWSVQKQPPRFPTLIGSFQRRRGAAMVLLLAGLAVEAIFAGVALADASALSPSGNSSVAPAIVITCPPDVQLSCGMPSDPAHTGVATATANCSGPVTVTFFDSPLPADCTERGLERTWTATACGRKSLSCVQRIVFLDTKPPEFVSLPNLDDYVPCGWPVPRPVALEIVDECDPSPSLVVSDIQFPPDSFGNYGIWRIWTATDRCGNSSRQVQLITVEGCAPSDATSSIVGAKFYDTNANGIWDADEPPIAGWKIVLAAEDGSVLSSTFTDSSGNFAFGGLAEGAYIVSAATPIEPEWQDTTAGSYVVLLGQSSETRDFGSVCLGSGDGRSIAFWTSKAGQRAFGDSKSSAAALTLLKQLNLRNPDGSDFDPSSYNQFKNWLLSAQTAPLPCRLSAELAAMALNLDTSFVKGESRVRAAGAASANALGYGAVQALVAEANRELGAHGSPPLDGQPAAWEPYQSALNAGLQAANDDQSFLQATPCAFSFPQ